MCSVQKDFFRVFQSLRCKISGILLTAKPSQQLLPMVVVLKCLPWALDVDHLIYPIQIFMCISYKWHTWDSPFSWAVCHVIDPEIHHKEHDTRTRQQTWYMTHHHFFLMELNSNFTHSLLHTIFVYNYYLPKISCSWNLQNPASHTQFVFQILPPNPVLQRYWIQNPTRTLESMK